MSDLAVEGTFRWAETHEEPDGYSNWENNQPNNSNNQDCVCKNFKFGLNGPWNDYPCSWSSYDGQSIHALCQQSE